MKRRKKKWSASDILDGASMAALIIAMFIMAVKVNAAGIDTELPEEYIRYCEEIGQAYHICPELLEAVIEAESEGDPDAVGEAGEIGLMQIYPEYHRKRTERLGVYSLFEPRGNILTGADYLAELFETYEDPGTVLMFYNGTGDAKARGKKGDYTEYAREVMERCEQLERLHKK